MEQLAVVLRKFRHVPGDAIKELLSIARPDVFESGTILLRPGRPGRRVYFIGSGLLRVYKETPKGISTEYLLMKDDLCIAPDSFVSGDPTVYYIAALKETQTISLTYEELKVVMDSYPELRDCVFAIFEKYRKEKEARDSDLHDVDPKDRVDWFRKNYPDLMGTIKDEMIWTFLGLNRDAYYAGKNGEYKGKPPKTQ